MKIVNIADGFSWRYQLYLRPHILLHGDPLQAVYRSFRNRVIKHSIAPVCYMFADASNVGDRTSALGVQHLAGLPGLELFASPAGLGTTIKTLEWLQDHRPKAKILIGGGGLLQEPFVPFWHALLKSALPFALFGVGANELPHARNLPPSNLLKALARRATALHVRDNWTRELLEDGRAQITTGVCPAVNYLASRFPRRTERTGRYLLHVAHSVDIHLAGGDPDMVASRVFAVARRLGLEPDQTDHIGLNLEGLVHRYLRSQIVVTSRLHGCIFCHALGIPFLPIVTDRKTAAFIDTHLPGHAALSVSFTENDLMDAISVLAGASEDVGPSEFDAILTNNVESMKRILKSF